jgi:GntR family transcriptional regulator/MocR family aminotransferase
MWDRRHVEKRRKPVIAWDHLLSSLVCDGRPTQQGLMRALSEWIDDGRLPGGMKLPSTRYLATKLGIGRNTALFALSCLVKQGSLVSRERSGIYVAERKLASRILSTADRQSSSGVNWQSRFASETLSFDPEPKQELPAQTFPFQYGQFDLSLFPTSHWRECERAALGVLEIADWGRDMIDGDDVELIEQLRKNVLPHHGIWAQPDEIIVTLGGQQGRYLVARLLAKAGLKVGIEHPGMPDMAKILRLTGTDICHLKVDEDGAIPSAEMDSCDTVILTAGHQCPTTAVMPLSRREEILERARSKDFIVVEDTYEMELLRESGGVPALKSLDTSGRVIYIGSLSKQMAPGLRVGFIVAPAPAIRQLRALRRLMLRHPPGNNQRALAVFIERGYYTTFVGRVAREFGQRAAALQQASRRWLPDFEWKHRDGTSSFWFEVPAALDTTILAEAAKDRGILIESGTPFFDGHKARRNFFRLAVSSVPTDRIEAGIKMLAEVCEGLKVRS